MERDDIIRMIRKKYEVLVPILDERIRRLWASAEAMALGYGGQTMVAEATRMSRSTINIGLRELREGAAGKDKRVRSVGGGRKRLTDCAPALKSELEALVEPTTRGDPESPLRWTCKSTRQLAAALQKKGFKIGRQKVAHLLYELGYSLQANRKTKEGASHADRDGSVQVYQ